MVKLSGEKQQDVSFPSTAFEKETLIRMRVFQLLVLPKLLSLTLGKMLIENNCLLTVSPAELVFLK